MKELSPVRTLVWSSLVDAEHSGLLTKEKLGRVRIRNKLKVVGHRVMPRAGYCFARAVDSIFGREVALISE